MTESNGRTECSCGPKHEWLRPGLVTTHFQPIVDLTGVSHEVVAVEALARGPLNTELESPAALFIAARRVGMVVHLDRLCIETALEAAAQLPAQLEIFLNVHPSTLSACVEFPAFLAETAAKNGIAPTRITLEVLEHARVTQTECRQLRGAVEVMRGCGVRFAVDDVSGAQEDFRRALSLVPDFVKVDAEVVRGAQTDTRHRALLHAIADQAVGAGARVIAEGIEELRDLAAATAAGISMAQGYLLCRPQPVSEFAHMLAAR